MATAPRSNGSAHLPPRPVSHRRVQVILLVLSTAIFVTISYEAMPIGLLTEIATQLHTDPAGGGLLVSSYALVVVLGSIPLSAVVARFPARAVLLAMLVVLALSSALVATSTTLGLAVAARLLGGAAHAIIFTAAFRIALAVVPRERRGRAAGTIAAGNAVALSLGLPAATAVGGATSWRLPFGAAAAAFVLIAVVVTLVVPARLPTTEPDSSAKAILAAVRLPSMLRVGITVVITIGAHFATYTYIQPILVQIGLSLGQISAIQLGYGAAGVVGLLVVTPWVDRCPRALTLATTALLCVALAGLWWSRPHLPTTIASVLVWGLALGAFPVLAQVMALRASPATPSAAAPMSGTTFNIGITVGSAAGGLLLTTTSSSGLIAASTATVAVILVVTAVPRWLPADRPGRGR
jgi:predicted MFS family arabinose efflux permease